MSMMRQELWKLVTYIGTQGERDRFVEPIGLRLDWHISDDAARLISKAWLLPEIEEMLRDIVNYKPAADLRLRANALLAQLEKQQ